MVTEMAMGLQVEVDQMETTDQMVNNPIDGKLLNSQLLLKGGNGLNGSNGPSGKALAVVLESMKN